MSLKNLLDDCVYLYRKGAVDAVELHGAWQVREYFGYPLLKQLAESPGVCIVDVHFLHAVVNRERAEEHRREFEAWLATYPEPGRLHAGPSYIEVAAVLDIGQEAVLRVFALGQALGLWQVIIPETLGVRGPHADVLAGNGLILISGYAPVARVSAKETNVGPKAL